MKIPQQTFFLMACIGLTAAASAHADVATITALRDTTIYEDDGTLSNGSGTSVIAGATGSTGSGLARRALLYFDVAAGLPAGSTIESATLRLYLAQTQAEETDVAIHALTGDWGESTSNADAGPGQGAPAAAGDATWTHSIYDTDTWTMTGGDFVATASATTSVGSDVQTYDWSSAGIAADVQSWLDDPIANYGWIVIGAEQALSTAKRFASREHLLPARHPALEITFTPPVTTGACCATDGTCTVATDPGTDCTGSYQGLGTGCTPNLCPAAIGACCLPVAAATCSEITAADCDLQNGTFAGGLSTCVDTVCPVVLEPFVDALPVLPVATPTSGASGAAATYDIAVRQITQKLHRDLPATTLWAYGDGVSGANFPGPSIEAAVGQTVTVNWINDLRDSDGEFRTDHLLPVDPCPHGAHHPGARVVTHLHGGHVPAEYDGYPEDTLLPGEQATYVYPNDQLAATLWYHDHALGITRLNVYLGLAALYVIRDDAEAALALPSGEHEVPLVIQDRTFQPDGQLVYPAEWTEHFFGDTGVVNGMVWPYFDVDRGKYRFRVANGSNSRTFTLSLSNGASFVQIGGDGGLLEEPITLDTLTLAPAERADVIIDFAPYAPGTEIVLDNSAPAPFTGTATHAGTHGSVNVDIPQVMKFIVGADAGDTTALPAALIPLDRIDESEAVVTRDFELKKGPDDCTGTAWLINGLRWDDITEYPRLGTAEIWRFVNRSGTMHPMHMHLTMFQVLDRQTFEDIDGEIVPTGSPVPPSPEEAGWKDTVRVNAHEIVRVIARFDDYKGRFAYHCHIIEHEDHEMMRQFETVDCGDSVLDPGENCDLGDENGFDCCTSDCEFVSAGTPCSDDGDVCTDDTCDGALICEHMPDSTNAPECAADCGDADNDGSITATDALRVLNAAMDIGTCPLTVCDVNSSGTITATDALGILNVAVGLLNDLDCPG